MVTMEKPILDRRAYEAGQQIFKAGDRVNHAYLVQTGSVEIFKEGSEEVLNTVGAGGIFGEMALIDDQPRSASARAISPCNVIVINRPMFEQKLKGSDPFVQALLKILVGNLRRSSK